MQNCSYKYLRLTSRLIASCSTCRFAAENIATCSEAAGKAVAACETVTGVGCRV